MRWIHASFSISKKKTVGFGSSSVPWCCRRSDVSGAYALAAPASKRGLRPLKSSTIIAVILILPRKNSLFSWGGEICPVLIVVSALKVGIQLDAWLLDLSDFRFNVNLVFFFPADRVDFGSKCWNFCASAWRSAITLRLQPLRQSRDAEEAFAG